MGWVWEIIYLDPTLANSYMVIKTTIAWTNLTNAERLAIIAAIVKQEKEANPDGMDDRTRCSHYLQLNFFL